MNSTKPLLNTQALPDMVNEWEGFAKTDGGKYVASIARDVARTVVITEADLFRLATVARTMHGEAVKLTVDKRASLQEVKTSAAYKTTTGGTPVDWGKLPRVPTVIKLARLAEAVYILRKLGAVSADYRQVVGGELAAEVAKVD